MANIFNYIVLCAISLGNFDFTEAGYKRRPALTQPCPKLTITNAIIKYRRMNTVAKIRCKYGTIIMGGVRRLACLRGKWNGKIPQCISAGCEDVDFSNGEALEMYDGALIHFTCDPGYKLAGSPALFCDGKSWNGSVPTCEIPPPAPDHLSCIFEDVGLCGWTQDHLDDYDWKWSTGALNALTGSYGAKVDATFGSSSGHYIYADSRDNWTSAKKARIFSPMLKMPGTTSDCVTFKYHINGPGTGHLNVYFKPQDIPFELMVADAQIKDHNCDQWSTFVRSLQTADIDSEYFQVVLEAWGGDGYVSDIAIDDFKIKTGVFCFVDLVKERHKLHDEDCPKDETKTTTKQFDLVSTCRHRCGLSNLGTMTCDCHENCTENHNCCDDYHEVCFTKDSTTPKSSATSEITEKESTETTAASTITNSQTTRRKIYFVTTTPLTWPTLHSSASNTPTLKQKTLTPSETTTDIPTEPSTSYESSTFTTPKTTTSTLGSSSTSSTSTTVLTTTEKTTTQTPITTSSIATEIFTLWKTTTRPSIPFIFTQSSETYTKPNQKQTTQYISTTNPDLSTPPSSFTESTTLISLALESTETGSHSILIAILCVIVIVVICSLVLVYIKREKQKRLYEYSDINTPENQSQMNPDSQKDRYSDVSYKDIQRNLESYVQLNNDCEDDAGTPV